MNEINDLLKIIWNMSSKKREESYKRKEPYFLCDKTLWETWSYKPK